MQTLKGIEIKTWIAALILSFLNTVESPSEIIEGIQDDPNNGSDSSAIGEAVATRILEKRASLNANRFNNLTQLEDIQGLGPDKVKDMIYSLGVSAATAFRQSLFNGVLAENWELKEYTIVFENEEALKATVQNGSNFKNFVLKNYFNLDSFYEPPEAKLFRESFVETYDVTEFAAIAFGLYFYQIDSDNWFGYETIRNECSKYLNYHPRVGGLPYNTNQELHLFKGFRDNRASATSNTQGSLPVVVNYAENSISIWEAILND